MSGGDAADYPTLDTLIGGWFHQDWDIEGGTLEAVIASYKRVYPPDTWAQARADIDRLLGRCGDDQLTSEFIRLFTPDIDPEAWGGTRSWLLRIADLLR